MLEHAGEDEAKQLRYILDKNEATPASNKDKWSMCPSEWSPTTDAVFENNMMAIWHDMVERIRSRREYDIRAAIVQNVELLCPVYMETQAISKE